MHYKIYKKVNYIIFLYFTHFLDNETQNQKSTSDFCRFPKFVYRLDLFSKKNRISNKIVHRHFTEEPLILFSQNTALK